MKSNYFLWAVLTLLLCVLIWLGQSSSQDGWLAYIVHHRVLANEKSLGKEHLMCPTCERGSAALLPKSNYSGKWKHWCLCGFQFYSGEYIYGKRKLDLWHDENGLVNFRNEFVENDSVGRIYDNGVLQKIIFYEHGAMPTSIYDRIKSIDRRKEFGIPIE